MHWLEKMLLLAMDLESELEKGSEWYGIGIKLGSERESRSESASGSMPAEWKLESELMFAGLEGESTTLRGLALCTILLNYQKKQIVQLTTSLMFVTLKPFQLQFQFQL